MAARLGHVILNLCLGIAAIWTVEMMLGYDGAWHWPANSGEWGWVIIPALAIVQFGYACCYVLGGTESWKNGRPYSDEL